MEKFLYLNFNFKKFYKKTLKNHPISKIGFSKSLFVPILRNERIKHLIQWTKY